LIKNGKPSDLFPFFKDSNLEELGTWTINIKGLKAEQRQIILDLSLLTHDYSIADNIGCVIHGVTP
jgi:hypothetical protein